MPEQSTAISTREAVGCRGWLTLTVRDAATGTVVRREVVDNLIVTGGIALLAQALNYTLILTENAGWGSPYSAPVGALYGAVGTSATAASAGQTALLAEVGRAVVSNAAVSSATLGYDFFFPTTLGNGTLAEAGVLGVATLVTPVLTASVNSGSTYTALTVGGVVGAIPTSAPLVLGYGTGTTQAVTTSAPVSIGDTSIAVASFVASATFTTGTLIGYIPGTLIDRAVLATPVTKTTAQTMTMNLTLTLISA